MVDEELWGHLEDLLEMSQRERAACATFDSLLDQRESSPLILGLQEVKLGLKAAELDVETSVVRRQWQMCTYLFIHDLLGRAGICCRIGGAVLQREGVGRVHHLERACRVGRACLLQAWAHLALLLGGGVRPHAVVDRSVLDHEALVFFNKIVKGAFL